MVTGEIGAGKTTLVRTLLEGIDSDEVAAAQVLNTQLESGELLQAILTAFGVPRRGRSKAQLLASLEAFLTSVAAEGRRALLIVDEAQNLGREAIEELRMLSNFQLGNHALLQSFLIGQPELRKQLESPAMEQLRQRVIASCHLGPLGRGGDASLHRAPVAARGLGRTAVVRRRGVRGIHQWTGGIPRGSTCCAIVCCWPHFVGRAQITGALVRTTAAIWRARPAAPVSRPRTPRAARARPLADAVPCRPPPARREREPRARHPRNARSCRVTKAGLDPGVLKAPLLLMVDSPLGAFKAAVLAKALAAHEELPACVLVTPGEPGDADPGALAPGLSESLAHADSPASRRRWRRRAASPRWQGDWRWCSTSCSRRRC